MYSVDSIPSRNNYTWLGKYCLPCITFQKGFPNIKLCKGLRTLMIFLWGHVISVGTYVHVKKMPLTFFCVKLVILKYLSEGK